MLHHCFVNMKLIFRLAGYNRPTYIKHIVLSERKAVNVLHNYVVGFHFYLNLGDGHF